MDIWKILRLLQCITLISPWKCQTIIQKYKIICSEKRVLCLLPAAMGTPSLCQVIDGLGKPWTSQGSTVPWCNTTCTSSAIGLISGGSNCVEEHIDCYVGSFISMYSDHVGTTNSSKLIRAYRVQWGRCVCELLQRGYGLNMCICQRDLAKQQLSPTLLHKYK